MLGLGSTGRRAQQAATRSHAAGSLLPASACTTFPGRRIKNVEFPVMPCPWRGSASIRGHILYADRADMDGELPLRQARHLTCWAFGCRRHHGRRGHRQRQGASPGCALVHCIRSAPTSCWRDVPYCHAGSTSGIGAEPTRNGGGRINAYGERGNDPAGGQICRDDQPKPALLPLRGCRHSRHSGPHCDDITTRDQ